jgi:hypothetical protein
MVMAAQFVPDSGIADRNRLDLVPGQAVAGRRLGRVRDDDRKVRVRRGACRRGDSSAEQQRGEGEADDPLEPARRAERLS